MLRVACVVSALLLRSLYYNLLVDVVWNFILRASVHTCIVCPHRGSFGPRDNHSLRYHIEPLQHHLGSANVRDVHVHVHTQYVHAHVCMCRSVACNWMTAVVLLISCMWLNNHVL